MNPDIFLSGDERVRYILLYLIAESEHPFTDTDERTYCFAQSAQAAPLWIWFKETPTDGLAARLCALLRARKESGVQPQINGDRAAVSMCLSAGHIPYEPKMDMIAYANRHPHSPAPRGEMILAEAAHRPVIARFISDMNEDIEGQAIPKTQADAFAERVTNEQTMYLWRDEGKIVSMACVAQRTSSAARLNAVFTNRENRNRGYAKMLMSALSDAMLKAGRTPMLYADKHYPASNAAYMAVGFENVGELTTFTSSAL